MSPVLPHPEAAGKENYGWHKMTVQVLLYHLLVLLATKYDMIEANPEYMEEWERGRAGPKPESTTGYVLYESRLPSL
ncbi:hypothetical protein KDK_06460 [Dictyobacter kobayashii]|uniref:Uncharacterized protein n=1 Tax=Dictyobacter kobayashii TaxID=2014872 RepID=A0A402ACP1_9CHLR|nr:hypothetical protein KDK_06460 [Dictyobacter kobayashii]